MASPNCHVAEDEGKDAPNLLLGWTRRQGVCVVMPCLILEDLLVPNLHLGLCQAPHSSVAPVPPNR